MLKKKIVGKKHLLSEVKKKSQIYAATGKWLPLTDIYTSSYSIKVILSPVSPLYMSQFIPKYFINNLNISLTC